MSKKRDYIDQIKKAGAFVIPPKRPVIVVEDPTVDSVITPVEEMRPEEPAYTLIPKREQVPLSEPDSTLGPAPPDNALADGDDGTLDFVCVHWDGGRGSGFARFPNEKKRTTNGFRIREENVLTEGTLKPGVMVRGKLIQSKDSETDFEVVEIEIYQN
jgi:hypothetical protein